jgi:hypothetical protein
MANIARARVPHGNASLILRDLTFNIFDLPFWIGLQLVGGTICQIVPLLNTFDPH